MNMICEGPHCEQRLTQPKTGRRRRFCSAACRKASYDVRHNTIVWEPLDGGQGNNDPSPNAAKPVSRPDEEIASAIVEARTLAGKFAHLSRYSRPQLAWRCEKTGAAIHAALDSYFEGVDR